MTMSKTCIPGYLPDASREETHALLKSRVSGTYLIRKSTHFPGDHTLSLCSDDSIEHYRIKTKHTVQKPYTIDEEIFFDNFEELIQHYTLDADGLCCKLTEPITSAKKLLHIEKSLLTFQESIGKGEFSEVHKAVYKNIDVAVKIVKDKSLISLFKREVSMMLTLNHPNLVQLIGIVDENDQSLCIVTEYMGKGSLLDYMRTRGRSVITPQDQIKFARDVCSGMVYLEEKRLVHRDLAARNVLIHDNGLAKVSDFGLAVNDEIVKVTGCKIPVKWTAPEALKHNNFTNKSDVWSFGVLLWEIYTFGRVPYPRISLNDVLQWVEEGNRMDQPDGCPEEIYRIMNMAWKWNSVDRPTFKEIYSLIVECGSTDV